MFWGAIRDGSGKSDSSGQNRYNQRFDLYAGRLRWSHYRGILAQDPAKVAETLKSKPGMVHIILTGRNARPTIVELADTVTEMRRAKHAYEKGVMARRGIGY
jgi:hypothetical protein